jgi:hypothetical protein
MKHPFLPLVALLCSMFSSGQAFTLDAAGYEGGGLQRDPMSLRVPGYGEVVFDSGFGAALVVDSGYETVASLGGLPLSFDQGDAVKISVKSQASDAGGDARLLVDANDGGQTASDEGSVWKSIPEPASAWLGLVGLLLLFIGRRR